MTELRFDGRVAIVTGAGRGLGRAHALLLASRGASVVVDDPGVALDGSGADTGPADDVAAEIRRAGGTAVATTASVATEAGAAEIVQTALDAFGRVDVVVNNAGIIVYKPFHETTQEELDRHLAVHVGGSFNVSRAAWPHLLASGTGRIVMTTSTAFLGKETLAAYAAAKGGIVGLMRTLAVEGAPRGIKVNAVAPSAASRMAGGSGPAGTFSPGAGRGTPEDVSPLVAVLAHERCPVTGEIYTTAEGWVARIFVAQTNGWVGPGHSPEQLLEHWDAVNDDERTVVLPDLDTWSAHRRPLVDAARGEVAG